jgi:hypothetical protein
MTSLLLARDTWDLVIDANANVAVATAPYALAQEAACAIQTWAGEEWFNTAAGVPYLTQVFTGVPPSLPQIKQLLINAALTVPGVASAQVYVNSISLRGLSGQVQITSSTGQTAAAGFAVVNPQGTG